MTALVWEKDGFEDWKARTQFGDYGCIRNRGGSSVLWFKGEKLGVYGGGSHTEAMAAAELHHQQVLKDNDPMRGASVEAVARAFCKRMGLDPDEMVGLGYPRWIGWREKAREVIAMHLAIKEVLG